MPFAVALLCFACAVVASPPRVFLSSLSVGLGQPASFILNILVPYPKRPSLHSFALNHKTKQIKRREEKRREKERKDIFKEKSIRHEDDECVGGWRSRRRFYAVEAGRGGPGEEGRKRGNFEKESRV